MTRSAAGRVVVRVVVATTVVATAAGCGASAEDRAEQELRKQVAVLVKGAGQALQQSPDPETVRQDFAEDHGQDGHVFGSAVDAGAVHWDLVLLGKGSDSQSWTYTETILRTCIRLTGSPGAASASASTIPCPDDLDKTSDWGSFDRDVDVLDD